MVKSKLERAEEAFGGFGQIPPYHSVENWRHKDFGKENNKYSCIHNVN